MTRPEFAHYYGDWDWRGGMNDWVKSLLLFFDGIALALPEDRAERLIESNPVLAQPLAELGLLRNFWPDASVNAGHVEVPDGLRYYLEKAAKSPSITLKPGMHQKILDRLAATTVESDMKDALTNLAARVNQAQQKFGDTPSNMRALTVGAVSRFLVQNVTEVAIQPVINDQNAASYVSMIIDNHDGGRAKIMISDLQEVGVDLQSVPLDEVLDFRRQHGSEYRSYSKELRQFVLDLSMLSEFGRTSAIEERRAELRDRAEELKRAARNAFKRQILSVGFGLAGAAWTLVHGDPWGGLFAAGATAAGFSIPSGGDPGAAYAYVLQAKAEMAR